jgi:hypothetical protein
MSEDLNKEINKAGEEAVKEIRKWSPKKDGPLKLADFDEAYRKMEFEYDYKVISSDNCQDLAMSVTAMMTDGYYPHGSIAVSSPSPYFYQPMIRSREVKKT